MVNDACQSHVAPQYHVKDTGDDAAPPFSTACIKMSSTAAANLLHNRGRGSTWEVSIICEHIIHCNPNLIV